MKLGARVRVRVWVRLKVKVGVRLSVRVSVRVRIRACFGNTEGIDTIVVILKKQAFVSLSRSWQFSFRV